MENTPPNATSQPQTAKHHPAESSMLRSVPAFVRPKRSSLALVRTNTSANSNLKSRAPSAPTPATRLPHGDPCFTVAGPPSRERLKAAIRAETTWCWVASAGNRSSAWRQAADRKSTRLNSSHLVISYAVFCLKKKKKRNERPPSLVSSFQTTE